MGNTLPRNPSRDDYIVYAEKIEKSKPDRAVEIYQDIVRELRLEKNWAEAIDILLKMARLQVDQEKAKSFTDIANLYKKIDSKELYVKYLEQAINVYKSFGGFSNCGKYCVLIAEDYESALDYKNAIEYYTRAIDYYGMADMDSNSTRYSIKLAILSSLDPNRVEDAIILFEKVAENYSKNKLTVYNVPEYLFRAGLCRLLKNDLEDFRKAITNYSIVYPIFSTRRESTLLNMILDSIEARDTNGFTALVVDYNNQSTIDDWTTSMLLAIKKTISDNNLC
jgi:alpha-soluble NSF attachment protein